MNKQEQTRRVTSRKTPEGWILELDNASWSLLMTGFSVAIDHCTGRQETELVTHLRTLRTQVSQAETPAKLLAEGEKSVS